MSHPQPSLSGTGVLWVSTSVLIRRGRAVDQQCASSCVVWIVVSVHSDVVVFKQEEGRRSRTQAKEEGEGRRSRLAKETGGKKKKKSLESLPCEPCMRRHEVNRQHKTKTQRAVIKLKCKGVNGTGVCQLSRAQQAPHMI